MTKMSLYNETDDVQIIDDMSLVPNEIKVKVYAGVRVQSSENIPIATTTSLGTVQIGTGLSITQQGVLSVDKINYSDIQGTPEIPTKISELQNDSGFITNLVNDLVNYYTKEEIEHRISLIPKFEIKVVDTLPTTDISPTTVYLTKADNDVGDLYAEWIYVNAKWELLGRAKVDVSGFALKTDIPTKLSQLQDDIGYITQQVADQRYQKAGNYIEVGDIPVASSSQLGTIMLGHGTDNKFRYGVELNEENRAFVSVPAVAFSPQNLTEEEKGTARDNIEALGREQAKELYQPIGNYLTDIPIASPTRLGGIKVGSGLVIDQNGVLSSTAEGGNYTWENIQNKPFNSINPKQFDVDIDTDQLKIKDNIFVPTSRTINGMALSDNVTLYTTTDVTITV